MRLPNACLTNRCGNCDYSARQSLLQTTDVEADLWSGIQTLDLVAAIDKGTKCLQLRTAAINR